MYKVAQSWLASARWRNAARYAVSPTTTTLARCCNCRRVSARRRRCRKAVFIAPSVSKLERRYRIVILHVMNRATFIEKLTEVQQIVGQLLRLLQASEHDKFVAHLYQARKHYRFLCERPNKGNKAIERELISSCQVAQSLGFNGDFRAWQHLLRIHA